jgi:8-oxo-dGTP pyrophosphatase MutT (NUDIX family)
VLSFDPNREVVTPLPAASVLPLRDGAAGLEVFCIERSGKSGFLSGAVVFPGGKVSPADRGASLDRGRLHSRCAHFSAEEDALALVIAAARETLEEASLLPAAGLVEGALERLAGRVRVKGAPPLVELLAEEKAELALESFVPFGRWVTPEAEQRRFDARFFLVRAPDGQRGAADEHEAVNAFWAAPTEILARFEKGQVFLAPPTTRMLELLAPLGTVADATALAAEQSLEPICPTFVPADPPYLALPGDPSHAIGERRVAGGTRFVLTPEGRFVSADPR